MPLTEIESNYPKNKLHRIADYVENLKGEVCKVYSEDVYQRDEDSNIYYIKHRRGDMLESEMISVRNDLIALGCLNISISFRGNELRVYLEVSL